MNYKGILLLTAILLSIVVCKAQQQFKSVPLLQSKISSLQREAAITSEMREFKPSTQKSASLLSLLDSSFTYFFDTALVAWEAVPQVRNTILNYDSNYHKILELRAVWDGSTYQNNSLYGFNYDSAGRPTAIISYYYIAGTWENQYKTSFYYDSIQHIKTQVNQTWDGLAWVNSTKIKTQSDSFGNLICETDYNWDVNALDWRYTMLDTNTYDALHNKLLHIKQFWNFGVWKNEQKEIFSYNAAHQLSTKIVQDWNGTIWENVLKHVYSYDAYGNLQTDLALIFYSFTNWANYWRDVYTYTANNQLKDHTFQLWSSGSWLFMVGFNYTYYPSLSLKSLAYKAANGISPDIMYADSTVYYYHIVTAQEPLMAEASAIVLYPNPAKDMVQLHCETPLALSSMSIRNSAGVPIYESALNLMPSLDLRIALPNLAAGYYALCLQRKDGTFETKKLLIVK